MRESWGDLSDIPTSHRDNVNQLASLADGERAASYIVHNNYVERGSIPRSGLSSAIRTLEIFAPDFFST